MYEEAHEFFAAEKAALDLQLKSKMISRSRYEQALVELKKDLEEQAFIADMIGAGRAELLGN